MRRLTRYDILDAYTLEEVRREYEASDATGRIRLLRTLNRTPTNGPPYEIALRAVEDPNPQVRAWIARNGKLLDFRESHFDGDKLIYSLPERNLEERLQNDPDPFVRACWLENEAISPITWFDFGEQFQKSSPLERLAMVRNPRAYEGFIEKLFDCQDKELAISLEERKGLILAYLTNTELVKQNEFQRREERMVDEYMIEYAVGVERHLSHLWELAASWPDKSGIPHAIYTYVNAPDSTKAKVYQAQKDPYLRRAILYNCDYRDRETLKLGREDSDEGCREAAMIAGRERRKSSEQENVLEFREEVRGGLQEISSAVHSLRGWVFAIAAVVFYLMATRLFPGLLM